MWQNKHNFIKYTESNNDVYGSHHSVKDLFIPQLNGVGDIMNIFM